MLHDMNGLLMDLLAITLLEIFYGIASLALISLGLAIIFGMLRVINFAHGEFLMIGGFSFIMLTTAGVNMWIAMLIGAPLIVGLLGIVVERVVIRNLYGRIVETILATWGLSLFLLGAASLLFGYFQRGVSPPFGTLKIGNYQEGVYSIFVIVLAAAVYLSTYLVLRYTKLGLIARATMQIPKWRRRSASRGRRFTPSPFSVGRHSQALPARCWRRLRASSRHRVWLISLAHSLRSSPAARR